MVLARVGFSIVYNESFASLTVLSGQNINIYKYFNVLPLSYKSNVRVHIVTLFVGILHDGAMVSITAEDISLMCVCTS